MVFQTRHQLPQHQSCVTEISMKVPRLLAYPYSEQSTGTGPSVGLEKCVGGGGGEWLISVLLSYQTVPNPHQAFIHPILTTAVTKLLTLHLSHRHLSTLIPPFPASCLNSFKYGVCYPASKNILSSLWCLLEIHKNPFSFSTDHPLRWSTSKIPNAIWILGGRTDPVVLRNWKIMSKTCF